MTKKIDMQPARSPERVTGTAEEMFQLIRRLYPICRSITGNGVRQTLKILQEYIPLMIREVPSETPVFDWTIPKEWNIRDAYIKDLNGNKIVDFGKSNLHIVSYSTPVHARFSLDELKKHLFTLPEHPDWIPYRTSYYQKNWGFCLTHHQFAQMKDGEYEVYIDSSLQNGSLTYGEYYLQGEREDEVLISCHICHPALANDNLSGMAIATLLAKHLSSIPLRCSYRFLFTPGTIGSITWLCLNEGGLGRIRGGLVLACLGDSGRLTYKKSRRGDAEIDRAVGQALKETGDPYETVDFSPYGYDERQFCSPGFNLPVGCFMRTPHGKFPEYHTSADNLQFVKPEFLADSFLKCMSIIRILERNKKFLNQNPKCEPQLGRRGLYGFIGGETDRRLHEFALLWVLNLSDGRHSLLEISQRSGVEFDMIHTAAQNLLEHGLLKEIDG